MTPEPGYVTRTLLESGDTQRVMLKTALRMIALARKQAGQDGCSEEQVREDLLQQRAIQTENYLYEL